MNRKIVYVLQSSSGADAKPSVFIEVTKDGSHVFGVRASGSSLKLARDRAQREFKGLTAFVHALQSKAKT